MDAVSQTISNPRVLVAGEPIGLAPAGRTACVLPMIFPNANADENLSYGIDFVQRLAGSVDTSITRFIVSTSSGGGPPLVADNQQVSGTQAIFSLSGGVAGVEYLVTVVAQTPSGQTLSAYALLYIQPPPSMGLGAAS